MTGAIVSPTVTASESATYAGAVTGVLTLGRTISGVGRAVYKRATSQPSHPLKFRSLDRYLPDGSVSASNGGWWEISEPEVTPEMAGALGGGIDDTAALQDLLSYGGASLWSRTYLVSDTLTVSTPATIRCAEGGATVNAELGLSGKALFAINTDDFSVTGLSIVGTGALSPATGNSQGFFIGQDGDAYDNISLRKIHFSNFAFTDGLTGFSNILVSHCIYAVGVSNLVVEDCSADVVSGAAVFLSGTAVPCDRIFILRNRFNLCKWYPVNLDSHCTNVEIGWNKISYPDSAGTFYGGGINAQSQPPFGQSENINCHDNEVSGYYGYGSAMRFESVKNLTVENNIIRNYDVADLTNGTVGFTALLVNTRGVFAATLSATMTAGYTGNITVTNPAGYGLDIGVPYSLRIDDEYVIGVPVNGIVIGGAFGVTTTINITARAQNGTAAASHSAGHVIANQSGPCQNIKIRGNRIAAPNSVVAGGSNGIYLGNEWQVGQNPMHYVVIENNRFEEDFQVGANFLTNAVLANGLAGQIHELTLRNNHGVVRTITGTSTGGFSLSQCVHLQIDSNYLRDVGDATHAAYQVAMAFSLCDQIYFGRNLLINFYTGIEIGSDCGSAIRDLYIQDIQGATVPYGGSLPVSPSQQVKDVVSFVFDMHWKALRGIPWDSAEAGGIVPYTLSAPAAVGDYSIVLTGAVPVATQLLVLLSTDTTYYTVSVSTVVGTTVTLNAPLTAAVAAGQTAWNFYINESHPNEYGYRAIADELVRSTQVAEHEVYRGMLPYPVGTATVVAYFPGLSALNPGSGTAPSYLCTPAAALDGCSWFFKLKKAGQHRLVFKVNTAGGDDLHARILFNGIGVYDWTVANAADGYPQELFFEASDIGDIEVRLFRLTGTNIFFTSYLSVMQLDGLQLTRFDTGRHVMFGDSWFAIASDDGSGDFGIIDRMRERFPAATWINEGHGGDTSASLVARLGSVPPHEPDYVHILCGTDDYNAARSADTVGGELGRVRAFCISIGAIPILYTSSAGSPTVSSARFNLSRKYVRDIGYWSHKRQVQRYSFSVPVGAGTTGPLLSIGRRAEPFIIGEHYLSHDCDMKEGGTQPAGTLIATIASGYSATPTTLTPASRHFVQLLHTNPTGADYTVSGYIDIDDEI